MSRLHIMGCEWLLVVVVAFESAVVWTNVLVAEVSDAHGIFTLDDGEAEILLDELLLVVLQVLDDSVKASMRTTEPDPSRPGQTPDQPSIEEGQQE